jgi:hypothetical protein
MNTTHERVRIGIDLNRHLIPIAAFESKQYNLFHFELGVTRRSEEFFVI